MSYRDDDAARSQRANSLIDEIAELERQKVSQAQTDQRLEDAKRELSTLQGPPVTGPVRGPGVLAHLLVFVATAGVAFLGYTVLLS